MKQQKVTLGVVDRKVNSCRCPPLSIFHSAMSSDGEPGAKRVCIEGAAGAAAESTEGSVQYTENTTCQKKSRQRVAASLYPQSGAHNVLFLLSFLYFPSLQASAWSPPPSA